MPPDSSIPGRGTPTAVRSSQPLFRSYQALVEEVLRHEIAPLAAPIFVLWERRTNFTPLSSSVLAQPIHHGRHPIVHAAVDSGLRGVVGHLDELGRGGGKSEVRAPLDSAGPGVTNARLKPLAPLEPRPSLLEKSADSLSIVFTFKTRADRRSRARPIAQRLVAPEFARPRA